jgi:hypothetical protein
MLFEQQGSLDYKKGEVNELKVLLRNRQIERDPKKRREVIKKVIGYQSLGIDVSKLFSDMIMAVATSDLVVKKMVYFYLTSHAEQKPELALLAINTLQKDCRDDDPSSISFPSVQFFRFPLTYILALFQWFVVWRSAVCAHSGILSSSRFCAHGFP